MNIRSTLLVAAVALVHTFLPYVSYAANTPTDTILQDSRGNLILWETESNRLEIWSPTNQTITPLLDLQGTPVHLTYSAIWDGVLIGYANGNITQVPIDGSLSTEAAFANIGSPIHRLAAAGNHLVVAVGESAPDTAHSFRQDGTMVNSYAGNFQFEATVWHEDSGSLFHVGDELFITRLSGDGTIVSHQSRGPHITFSPNPHLSLSTTGDRLLVDNGDIFQTPELNSEYLSNLFRANAGVWTDKYLFSANRSGQEVRLIRSSSVTFDIIDSLVVPGIDPKLFVADNGDIVLVTQSIGRTLFSVFDQELDLKSRVSYLGSDLLDTSTRLSNLSTRVNLTSALSVGFVIGGTDPMRVLLRAVGPGLTDYGVTNHLHDPQFELFNQQQESLLINDDWSHDPTSGLGEAFASVGAFPLEPGSKDAAMIVTLSPGAYTAQIRPKTPGGENVLFEVYDYSEEGSQCHLTNLSTLTGAGTGADALVVGFVVAGDSPTGLLVRSIGPGLESFNVPGLIADPFLTVRQSDGTVVAENDDWNGDQMISFAARHVGAYAYTSDSALVDSALIMELSPGPYTATATSKSPDESGQTLVEIYELE